MATVPLPRAEIVDLRQTRSRELAALFEEQQQAWQERLRWDYRPSVALIKKHVDAHSLPGYVAFLDGKVAGYCFFVFEETTAGGQKGLLGDLFVRQAYRPAPVAGYQAGAPTDPGLATELLEQALETLEATLGVTRIEAQLMPFGIEPLAPVFLAHDFRSYPRLFMYRDLRHPAAEATGLNREAAPAAGSATVKWQIEPWDDGFFEPLAELIVSAYTGHLDSRLNNQYASRSGALKFLKNIVVFPGCGVFQADASFVAFLRPSGGSHWVERGKERGLLAGAVLVSQVALRVGHITQICVRRELQGSGLGTCLLKRSLDSLQRKSYEGVSLSVTSDNHPAVRLYRRYGFEVLKGFAAFVRDKP